MHSINFFLAFAPLEFTVPFDTIDHSPVLKNLLSWLKRCNRCYFLQLQWSLLTVALALSSSSDQPLSLTLSLCYALRGWSHLLSQLQFYVNDYQIYISCLSLFSELQTSVSNHWQDTSTRIIYRHPHIDMSNQSSLTAHVVHLSEGTIILDSASSSPPYSQSTSSASLSWPFLSLDSVPLC